MKFELDPVKRPVTDIRVTQSGFVKTLFPRELCVHGCVVRVVKFNVVGPLIVMPLRTSSQPAADADTLALPLTTESKV
jgi:hypothetical protein